MELEAGSGEAARRACRLNNGRGLRRMLTAKRHDPDCRIEVTLTNGATIRIGQDVSLAMLRRVLTALGG